VLIFAFALPFMAKKSTESLGGRMRFGPLVFVGTLVGVALSPIIVLNLLTRGQVIGTGELRGTLVGTLIVGATFGAVAIATWRAYRVIILFELVFWIPVLTVLKSHDWAFVHSWGWIWVGVDLALLAAAVIAPVLARCGLIRRTPGGVTIMAALLGIAGAMVFCAVLAGQLGQQLGGPFGLRVGETVGGLLGALLGWLTITPFFYQSPENRSGYLRTTSQWIGLFVSVALANAGVLWVLLGDGAQGIEIRRVSSDGDPRDAFLSFVFSGKDFRDAVFGGVLPRDNRLVLCASRTDALPWKKVEAPELRCFPTHQFSATFRILSMDDDPQFKGILGLRLRDLASDVFSKKSKRELQLYVHCFAISPDGHHVLAGSRDGTLRLW
jgi:hypothetical protein